MLPASNATERIHPLSSTKSSNTPPALPNNEGIGQSASIVAPDIPQVVAHQGADERAAKRQRIVETSQETQSPNGGGVSSGLYVLLLRSTIC
jgi:hypothetical protein